ncbi:MAG TPA: LysM peptidoglycan-binding domain-containing protein [Polyangiaceae bacterium]|nr:LysM peptidoglycan-binding domain-containing protein [Polyangiaceae bacterium]
MAVASMHIERGHWERVMVGLVVVVVLALAGPAQAESRTHKVYRGQRLGSIAKRYHVSVAAIAHANDISNPAQLDPGRVLLIPDRDDTGGERAREEFDKRQEKRSKSADESTRSKAAEPKAAESKEPKAAESKAAAPKAAKAQKAKLHRVARGQTLGAIARRYRTSIAAMCHANEIDRRQPLKVGQQLVVPAPADEDGARALAAKERLLRAQKQTRALELRVDKKSWRKYTRAARRKGYVTLQGHHGRWRGYVVGRRGNLLPAGRKGIAEVLGPGIDGRLIRLIAKVSDKFGGRELRIVSGLRATSFVDDSRHKHGRAVDFHIPGVPNEALRDYLLTLDDVGVGYYPNSTFIHFDVRPKKTYWVDLAGPGEAPRYAKVLSLD